MREGDGIYQDTLALHTDLYQLTMADGYLRAGMAETEAVFHLSFREHPFGGGYAVACGIERAIDHVVGLRYDESDLEYLAGLEASDGSPLLGEGFIEYLRDLEVRVDVDAVPEGEFVFAGEPLVRVTGPLPQCQILETAVLNLVNFETLIATKAARVVHAAEGDAVLEFGLRRAQGVDGGLSASRASYVGGCTGTSNVLAGKRYGIPVKGTHAHSWVMAFDSEREAFERYAEVMPHNALLLVDTYDTIAGVEHAIEVGRRLRASGDRLLGVRLDSGDMATLSREARALLDEAGFEDASIVGSGDLDEYAVERLKEAGARIDTWGVGTRMVTAEEQPALGGVYKLSAVREPDGEWSYRIKLSESEEKSTIPGIQQVRRFFGGQDGATDGATDRAIDGKAMGDVVFDERGTEPETPEGAVGHVDLLQPYVRDGSRVRGAEGVEAARARRASAMERMSAEVMRLREPVAYPVRLGRDLERARGRLTTEAQAQKETQAQAETDRGGTTGEG